MLAQRVHALSMTRAVTPTWGAPPKQSRAWAALAGNGGGEKNPHFVLPHPEFPDAALATAAAPVPLGARGDLVAFSRLEPCGLANIPEPQ